MHEIESEIAALEEEKQQLEDAEEEIMSGDGGAVLYLIGDTFMELEQDTATEYIEEKQEKVEKDLEGLKSELTSAKKTLAELKVQLYDKFGKSINLEED